MDYGMICRGCPTPTKCKRGCRYPYRHHGPAVHGSKMVDYLISEASLREDKGENQE